MLIHITQHVASSSLTSAGSCVVNIPMSLQLERSSIFQTWETTKSWLSKRNTTWSSCQYFASFFQPLFQSTAGEKPGKMHGLLQQCFATVSSWMSHGVSTVLHTNGVISHMTSEFLWMGNDCLILNFFVVDILGTLIQLKIEELPFLLSVKASTIIITWVLQNFNCFFKF